MTKTSSTIRVTCPKEHIGGDHDCAQTKEEETLGGLRFKVFITLCNSCGHRYISVYCNEVLKFTIRTPA